MLCFGGTGVPIVLLHGLMGRARTWRRVAEWLRPYGAVYGLDARGHGNAPRVGPWTTERFADDVADALRTLDAGPAVLIGHSMGGLHAWATAATYPELVRAVVSEDFAPDQRGRTVETWRGYFESWPVPFKSLDHVREFFGDAGEYFADCVEERSDGFHLVADLEDLYVIAAEWGRGDYWSIVDEDPLPAAAGRGRAHGDAARPAGARRVPGRRREAPGGPGLGPPAPRRSPGDLPRRGRGVPHPRS